MRNKLLPVLLLLAAHLQGNAQIVAGITEKILDIQPGTAAGGKPFNLFTYNNRVYFTAENADGREVWITDGSPGGTSMLKDIKPGSPGSLPGFFKPMGGKLYFTANGANLWSTDGTPAGTQEVKSLFAYASLFAYNSSLLFAVHGGNGCELWISDGTNGGTKELKDINPGSDDAYPDSFEKLGSRVVFGAYADPSLATYTPWITDGTKSGTQQLSSVNVYAHAPTQYYFNGKEASDFCAYNGEAYFAANDGTTGHELWKTDGTPAGTVLVKEIAPAADASTPHAFRVYNGKLYFAVNTGNPAIDGLWVTTGTAASTVRLQAGISMGDGDLVEYAEMNGNLYFTASGKVWVTDGTISGTHAVLHSPDDPHRLTILKDKLFFFATSNTAPIQFTLFNLDDLGNFVPVSMPMSNAILPGIQTDTMGNCLYFNAAPEAAPDDIELYRFKDTTFNVGVNKLQAELVSSIYPNPATNSFSVKNVTGKNTSVYIYSLTSQLLLKANKTENIDIAQLPAGIYTVQIISDCVVTVGKLCKE